MRTKKSSMKTLTDQANDLVEQATPYVEAARERIVNDYLPAAQSMLADARDTARDVAVEARTAAADAAAKAEKSTRKSRKRAAKRARSKAKELAATAAATPATAALVEKVRPEKKKSGKKRFVLLLVLAGAGAAVFKRLRSEPSAQVSYAPPRPAPSPAPTSGPGATASSPVQTQSIKTDDVGADGPTDVGGASVGEALADSAEEPHEVTTPGSPAEVEDVSASGGKRKA